MCGVRKEEVFEILIGAKKPVKYKTPIERLKQIVEAQNLFSIGSKREEALVLAAEFYQGCLDKMEWEAVSELSYQFIERSRQDDNEYLRWLILSVLDVVEEECMQISRRQCLEKQIAQAMEVIVNFSSSKGKRLKEIYAQAGSKEQFRVILEFMVSHARCSDELRTASECLLCNYDMIPEHE